MLICKPITGDLEAVKIKLHKEYLIKAGHLSSFAHLEFTPLDSIIRPAMVILSGRIFDFMNKKVLALAAVVQFIYMASAVHFRVNDNDTIKKDPRDGSQFPVLVGDYLYGKFFTSLCDAEIVEYLRPLSQVICSIHEGGILRLKAQNSGVPGGFDKSLQEEIAYKETATLFETGCNIAADIAGVSQMDRNNITGFAREIGIALGLAENNAGIDDIESHLEKAGRFLDKLPRNNYHQVCRNFISQLQQERPLMAQGNGS